MKVRFFHGSPIILKEMATNMSHGCISNPCWLCYPELNPYGYQSNSESMISDTRFKFKQTWPEEPTGNLTPVPLDKLSALIEQIFSLSPEKRSNLLQQFCYNCGYHLPNDIPENVSCNNPECGCYQQDFLNAEEEYASLLKKVELLEYLISNIVSLLKDWETFDDDLKDNYVEDLNWVQNIVCSAVKKHHGILYSRAEKAFDFLKSISKDIEDTTGVVIRSLRY